MRTTLLLTVLFFGIGGGISAWYFSAHEAAKRMLVASMERISEAANAQDEPRLIQETNDFLADDAVVTMNVQFSVFAMGSNGARGWDYTHDKPQFTRFISEMIGKVDGYGMRLTLKEHALDEADNSQFTATMHASGFATGASLMMGRSVGTRYVITGDCMITGSITDKVQVNNMDCPIRLTQQADLSSPKLKDAIKELKGLKP